IQLESDIAWWDQAVLALGDQVGFTTSFAITGTIIKSTSLMQHVLDSADFTGLVEQAVKRFADNGELWDQWRNHYIDAAKDGRKPAGPAEDVFYQAHKAEMLEGTAVLWPREDAYWHLMVYRLSRGEIAFQSEIQNTPDQAGSNLGAIPLIPRP